MTGEVSELESLKEQVLDLRHRLHNLVLHIRQQSYRTEHGDAVFVHDADLAWLDETAAETRVI